MTEKYNTIDNDYKFLMKDSRVIVQKMSTEVNGLALRNNDLDSLNKDKSEELDMVL